MPEIRQLPQSVINKIAAGEVIERPASVVKELMENAADAGSTRIDVSIEQGGAALVRVADNGCGIRREQLPLAVASHATSKIEDADDLFRVGTLGFRGEALASISEVSHFCLRSRTDADTAGHELEIHGGQRSEIQPCGCPVGTIVEVRNLFHNTPVRRKFMRTTQTEMGHITEAFTRIALAFDQVHFTLRHNDRIIHDLAPVTNWRDRIATFFGDELASSLIAVNGETEGVTLSGYVADPKHSRANNKLQYLFLNGRHIRDRSLQHALGESYRGLLLTGRYPIAFLKLTVPPAAVDVNVHPTKLEVRFQNGSQLYSHLLGTLRQQFLKTDLTARVTLDERAGADAGPAAALDSDQAAQHRRDLTSWARTGGGAPTSSPTPATTPQQPLDLGFQPASPSVPEFRPFSTDNDRWSPTPNASAGTIPASPDATQPNHSGAEAASPLHAQPAGYQIHNRYLITENELGMVVIDQHALHERILYEQIREKVLSGGLETQKLLVPEPVTLTPAEYARALDNCEVLKQLGLEIEPFGGDSILVSSYPAMLGNVNASEVVRQLLDELEAEGKTPEARDVVDELLHMISCKAAIKAGDPLTQEEIAALLAQRHLFQDTHHCPHGRPTALVFTRDELDKRFLRT